MKKEKKSVLIAMCIGDGYIAANKTSKTCTLELNHTEKQLPYLKWKVELLRRCTGKTMNIKKREPKETILKQTGNVIKTSACYRATNSHKYFRILRKWLYPNGKKKLQRKYLEHLTPLGLAIWFMDDGTMYHDKTREKVCTMEIATHIPLEEANELIKMFKEKWDINFHLHKRGENQYCIRCYTKNAIKFADLLRPYSAPGMEYKFKLPNYYSQERTAVNND